MGNRLTGEIKMIKWGVIPNLPYWLFKVGQPAGKKEDGYIIIQILEELGEDGAIYYIVVCAKEVEKDKYGESFIWKKYNNKPDEVEYFSPDEKHNYVKV